MNICRTCKHYRHIRDDGYMKIRGPYGSCFTIHKNGGHSRPAWIHPAFNTADSSPILMVNPDEFGCILHEPATPEPEQT